jgi:zinc protease
MTTIIVGDFDFDEIIGEVIEKFDFKGRKNSEITSYKIDEPHIETKFFENYLNINTGFLMFGYLGTVAADLKVNIILDMLAIILGEGQSSRLYQNLIEKCEDSIFNVVSCDCYQFRDGGNFFVQANFEPSKKDIAIEMVKNEIAKLYSDKVTENEYKKAVKKLKARFADSAETVSDISETIGYYMTVCNGLELVDEYLSTLESVTIDDVHEVAKKYLALNKATISVLMPKV